MSKERRKPTPEFNRKALNMVLDQHLSAELQVAVQTAQPDSLKNPATPMPAGPIRRNPCN